VQNYLCNLVIKRFNCRKIICRYFKFKVHQIRSRPGLRSGTHALGELTSLTQLDFVGGTIHGMGKWESEAGKDSEGRATEGEKCASFGLRMQTTVADCELTLN